MEIPFPHPTTDNCEISTQERTNGVDLSKKFTIIGESCRRRGNKTEI